MNKQFFLCSDCLVVTNNKMVSDKFSCVFVDGTSADVMYKAIEFMSCEYSFYSHPIAGDIRLLRNPFRTFVLKRVYGDNKLKWDYKLEHSLRELENTLFDSETSASKDYATIDFDMFISLWKEDAV